MFRFFGGSSRADPPVEDTVSVRFILEDVDFAPETHEVLVLGSCPELGSFDSAHALSLARTSRGRWYAVVKLPKGRKIDYRYIVRDRRTGTERPEDEIYRAVDLTPAELEKVEMIVNVSDRWQTYNAAQHALPDESTLRELAVQSGVGRSDPRVDEVYHLKAEVSRLQRESEVAVQRRVADLTDALQTQTTDLTCRVAALQEQLARQRTEGAEARVEVERVRMDAKAIEDELHERLARVTGELEEARRELGRRAAVAESSAKQADAMMSRSQSTVVALEATISAMKAAAAVKDSRIASLERKVEETRADLLTMEKRFGKALAEAASERMKATRDRKRVEELEQELRSQRARRVSLERQLAEESSAASLACELADLEGRVSHLTEQLAASQTEEARLRAEVEEARRETATVRAAPTGSPAAAWKEQREAMRRALADAEVAAESADERATALLEEIESARASAQVAEAAMQQAQVAQEDAEEKAEAALVEMRRLRNEILDLKGSIRVIARVRPQSDEELHRQSSPCVRVSAGPSVFQGRVTLDVGDLTGAMSSATETGDGSAVLGAKEFVFDRVFGPSSAQEDVYEEVQPIVESFVDGFDATVFAYGQTGSGKTFTMQGTADAPGVTIRTIRDVFALLGARDRTHECTVGVSMLEIYNETVRDLLNVRVRPVPGSGATASVGPTERVHLEVRQGPDGVFVEDLAVLPAHSAEEVLGLVASGLAQRATSATAMNETSSRSHLVVQLHLTTRDRSDGTATRSRLFLIDLAGSERLKRSEVSGQALTEAQNINRSLASLGDVLAALQAHAKHVPFRNSKLTFLLKDALSGQGKVMMIVQVAPGAENAQESSCTLAFGKRAASIALGQATRHLESGISTRVKHEVERLQDRVASLTQQLETERRARTEAEEALHLVRVTGAFADPSASAARSATRRVGGRIVSRTPNASLKSVKDPSASVGTRDASAEGRLSFGIFESNSEWIGDAAIRSLSARLAGSAAGPGGDSSSGAAVTVADAEPSKPRSRRSLAEEPPFEDEAEAEAGPVPPVEPMRGESHETDEDDDAENGAPGEVSNFDPIPVRHTTAATTVVASRPATAASAAPSSFGSPPASRAVRGAPASRGTPGGLRTPTRPTATTSSTTTTAPASVSASASSSSALRGPSSARRTPHAGEMLPPRTPIRTLGLKTPNAVAPSATTPAPVAASCIPLPPGGASSASGRGDARWSHVRSKVDCFRSSSRGSNASHEAHAARGDGPRRPSHPVLDTEDSADPAPSSPAWRTPLPPSPEAEAEEA